MIYYHNSITGVQLTQKYKQTGSTRESSGMKSMELT